MLAGTRHHTRARRGIVLVLVLAMLGLLALIGVTFATFSGQARINARNYAQSVVRPQDDELMDFALQQLITDTTDPRSVLRGHSLARDMYGRDASHNGYVANHPTLGTLYINQYASNTTYGLGFYDLTTNIQANDTNFFGYNFTRWIIKVGYNGSISTLNVHSPLASTSSVTVSPSSQGVVYQTFEVVADSGFDSSSTAARVLTVAILDPLPAFSINNSSSTNSFLLDPPNTTGTVPVGGSNPNSGFPTHLINWGYWNPVTAKAQVPVTTQLPGAFLVTSKQSTSLGTLFPFVLDGRWLHAFNGPGMGTQFNPVTINYAAAGISNLGLNVPYSTYGNFRYNTLDPNTVGMDEDYDACDLENWFLALQSADGQVVIPSFHRPGIVRYQSNALDSNGNPSYKYDWDPGFRAVNWVDSASRILRPVAADGHDVATFHDLVPDATGKITYDVDNDGDGVTDSVWLDLGYPARRDNSGNYYKPLFAFMVIGLNGRIPLNTAGNLAGHITPFSSSGSSSPSNYDAGAGPAHSQHLGNSVSEIDPTYSLQNAYDPSTDTDPFNQLLNGTVTGSSGTWAGPSSTYNMASTPTSNSQVDNALNSVANSNNYNTYQGVDVRLTQLRNLLAGTRPQSGQGAKGAILTPFSHDTTGTYNGDTNYVWGSWPGKSAGTAYTLPNGIADGNDVASPNGDTASFTDPNDSSVTLKVPLVQATTPPVAGRWGEEAAVPGVPFTQTGAAVGTPRMNMIQAAYSNPVRAGTSLNASDAATYANNGLYLYDSNGDIVFPSDSADDNYNAFDVYPVRTTGEIGDADFYDAVGALILPVERMRRFVTPMDINGTGRVQTWNNGNKDYGPDNFGRVQFSSYFRPAGVAGVINTSTATWSAAAGTLPYGAIVYGTWSGDTPTTWASGAAYPPDFTNNPLHGYEWYKMPNSNQVAGSTTTAPTSYNGVGTGGMPVLSTLNPASGVTTPGGPPTFVIPTYNNTINSGQRLDGVNEADEMNLYAPNPLLDSPFGPTDLEWLYRQQDVDGAQLSSRLSQLAPVSFTNTIDGARRRRLFSLDSWETNNFVYTNDNPAGVFANNARFSNAPKASARLDSNNYYTPSLAHRDKKINLNYPLPVSNDPNEPVRQKWITETYQLLRNTLPPTSVDSAEELAQLSQYIINIIDFRDPDATMTHWVNPDVWITPGTQQTDSAGNTVYTNPVLTLSKPTLPTAPPTTNATFPLEQYGMEYNPVAINEVLAYGFQSRTGTAPTTAIYTNRFFIELVNTLTASYNPGFVYSSPASSDNNNYYGYGTSNTAGNVPSSTGQGQQASTLDLGGFSYTASDPYAGGCWDLVFTDDDAMSRPDPYRGDLLYNPNVSSIIDPSTGSAKVTTYGLVPLNRDSVAASFTTGASSTGATGDSDTGAPNGGDVTLLPISPNASDVTGASSGKGVFNFGGTQPVPPTPPLNYFYVIGSLPNSSSSGGTTTSYEANPIGTSGSTTAYPCVSQYIIPSFDPFNSTGSPPAFSGTFTPGVLPAPPTTTTYAGVPGFAWKIPTFGRPGGPTIGKAGYYWVCLRRPANPFAPVSQANPMVVVDSMRFPYIDGTANASGTWSGTSPSLTPGSTGITANTIFSAQRLQPYRGGHAVPMPNVPNPSGGGTITTTVPPDPRYGYTEQIAYPQTITRSVASGASISGGSYGLANATSGTVGAGAPASTNYIYHTLGYYNDSAENWDYFVFNDRDFSSVAELLLVPGCPPGLFTKQFVEFAPSQMNAANIFGQVTPVVNPIFPAAFTGTASIAAAPSGGASGGGSTTSYIPTPIATATVPFLDVSQATAGSAIGSQGATTSLPSTLPSFPTSGTYGLASPYTQPTSSIQTPVQPHAFPYLVDKFFYTGASTFYYPPGGTSLDPGSPKSTTKTPVVGGPGGDGWFKMLEFFEVPSQSFGSVGPVAQGVDFDWARQDSKPGLMNLNLIIDEEAFFAIFGRQAESGYSASTSGSSGYSQLLLNSIELPLLTSYNKSNQLVLPYSLPLSSNNSGATPIPMGGPPVPLVVSAIQPSGAPNFVYPITDQSQFKQHGYLATDPIQAVLKTQAGLLYSNVATGNRLKAAFAQFLWARHGGSGYLFAHGVGSTGNNSAVATLSTQTNAGAVPADFPFRSLSYPDINYTIMRPAAMPPSSTSQPPVTSNAANLFSTQTPSPSTSPYFQSASYYSPFVMTNTSFTTNTPIVYSGDPGVRSPFFNQGYVTSAVVNPYPATVGSKSILQLSGTSPYTVYMPSTSTTTATPTLYQLPPGVPLPLNVAFTLTSPPTGATNPITDSTMMPPPIPPARLFQIPDDFGAGQMRKLNYTGLWYSGSTAYGNIPPAVSNATDSGDPWINNFVANQLSNPYLDSTSIDSGSGLTYTMTNYPPSYTLNKGFPSLIWGGGNYYYSGSTKPPLLTASGVLPPASINYAPYGPNVTTTVAASMTDLTLYNGYTTSSGTPDSPYLGGRSLSASASVLADDRQHPFWRTELLQKAMNLTTVRTHQYAVWITVGFFEVKRQGDIGMLAQAAAGWASGNYAAAQQAYLAAFDIMGAEVGALNGQNVRFRGFFLVDRLKLTGFNPGNVGAFHNAIVYRKVIQ